MADTHETDKELWLEAHNRAPAFTLQPGQTLSAEDRAYARDRIRQNEEAAKREKAEDRAGYNNPRKG